MLLHRASTVAVLVLFPFLVLSVSVPSAAAQDAWVYQGGAPGVRVTAAGLPIEGAASAGAAIDIDPAAPLEVSISISPPAGETWEVRAVSVGLLVNGPGSEPPEILVRRSETESSLPPGWTVVINRTVELSALKRVGAGTFLMEAKVLDAAEAPLYAQTFYVHVPASVGTLLTAQGAALTAMSVATGYGLWQLAKDVKELRDAWDRHRKRKELARLDAIGRAEHTLEELASKAGTKLASAVELHRALQAKEKGLGPVRWSATGLGLGGVTLAWLQFLGYVALDAGTLLLTALEAGAIFLTLALLANTLIRRAKAKTEARGSARSIVPEGPRHEPAPLEAAPASDNRD